MVAAYVQCLLGIGTRIDLLHSSGMVLSFQALLHNRWICRTSCSSPAWIISAVIPSDPGLLFLFSVRIASSTSEYRMFCGSSILVGAIISRSLAMLSPPPWSLYRLLQYFVHCWMISFWDCRILPSWSCITLILGMNFLRSIFIRLYACLVFPITRPFSISSHCCCIQRSLSCLADFLTFLQRSLYCCSFCAEAFLLCFNVLFSSTSFNVSSDIQGFLLLLLAGIVASAAFLMAASIFFACSSRFSARSIFAMSFASFLL